MVRRLRAAGELAESARVDHAREELLRALIGRGPEDLLWVSRLGDRAVGEETHAVADLARDHQALNLVGALEDLEHLHLTHVPFDREVFCVARAAEDLSRLVTDALAPLQPAAVRTWYGPRRIALSAHVDAGTDMSAVTATDTTPGMNSEAAAGHCAGDCGGSGGVPDHSMLTMVCALALLAAAIVLLAPVLLARLGVALALLRLHGRIVLAALPHPRPPSLLVLSISRT